MVSDGKLNGGAETYVSVTFSHLSGLKSSASGPQISLL
jgi:hypothetical protein